MGVVHVVYLKVIGLSGILLDSQKTKATVSRNKDMLIPPRQMKASLAVVRGNQVYGVSPQSKRLSRILPSAVSTSFSSPTTPSTGDERSSMIKHLPQPRPVRRYIAVWDNSTIKATTTPSGDIDASTADSTILFETTLITTNATTTTTTNAWNVSLVPRENFELIVGLSSPTGSSVNTDVNTTIPIGVATLPIHEAAVLRGSSGKVVLDLPIRNITDFRKVDTNPFVNRNLRTSMEVESNAIKAKSKRNIFAVLKRRKNVTPKTTISTDVSTKLKQPCVYTLDTTSTGTDTATLRVELELHEKESNVEMGLSSELLYSDEPYNLLTDWIQSEEQGEMSEVVLTEESKDAVNNSAIETSVHSTSKGRNYDHMDDNALLEQSIERVLSIRGASTVFKSKFQFSPVRRFRVKSHNQDSQFDLTPVPAETQNRISDTPNPEESEGMMEDENDVKTRFLDLTIERILSMKESDDQFDNDNEDDVPLNKNDVPFDEQSFLSRDTVAIVRNKPITIKTTDIPNELSNGKPPRLNLKPDPSIRNRTFGSFWTRHKKSNTTDALSATISITGTESSTHSVSNTESDIESPPRIGTGTIKKVLLPDANNMLQSSVIDVPPSDHENVQDELAIIQEKAPVVKPVSILRKTNKASPFNLASAQITRTTEKLGTKSDDAVSVVSSSAETAVIKKKKPHVDYEDHFNQIIKELVEAKTPASDGPDTDTTASLQSSTTATLPPNPSSTYSTPLPSFVAEENEPVVMEETFAFGNTRDIDVKIPRKKHTENAKSDCIKAIVAGNNETPHQNRSIVPKRNLLAQNLFGLIDMQPCTVKLDQLLAPEDEELMSIDESWINENSTIDTFKTQRKGTIHDDLADLGLLWGDMCHQTGFRGENDDDSLLAEEGTHKDKMGTKQRWMAGLRRSKHHRKGYEYDEIDDNDHSQSSGISGGSFTDDNTIRSTTEESESGFSEVGTEVDVNDANEGCDNSVETPTKPVVRKTERLKKSQLLKQLGSHASRFPHSSKGVADDGTLEFAGDAQSLSSRITNRWSKNNIGPKMVDQTSPTEIFAVTASSLPPKAPKLKPDNKSKKVVVANVPIRTNAAIDGSHNGGSSNTDSATPQSFQLPKSITQSLVDFVGYVISPSPTPSVTLIPNVPTVLDTDDAASVGELTATTYERQVEVDEMRRQSKNQQTLTTSCTPHEISIENAFVQNVDEQAQQIGIVTSNEKTYFSEYDGTDSMSPEVAAAMEAAAAKQMADIIH